jgi:hypothetical protein
MEEGFGIALSPPLTVDCPADERLFGIAAGAKPLGLIVVNALLVRGNLPAATREVILRLH